MSINWFPGHMHKAGKDIQQILPTIDLVIEVLDARIPFSSENPLLASLRGDKPCIKILNKCDLADPEYTNQWQHHLESNKQIKTLALNHQQPEQFKSILTLCHKLLPGRHQAGKQIKAMIVGIPNVGKSTLINILAGRRIAKTGNEPAITKMQQRIQLPDDIVLFDTPGMLWPKLTTQHVGYRLAITGAIKDTAIDHSEIALYAAEYFLNAYPKHLKHRFELDILPGSAVELLETLGSQRGCLTAKGRIDLDKVSKILLLEYRSAKIGTLSLELPEMVDRELSEQALIDQKKAEKKAQRRKRNRSVQQTESQ